MFFNIFLFFILNWRLFFNKKQTVMLSNQNSMKHVYGKKKKGKKKQRMFYLHSWSCCSLLFRHNCLRCLRTYVGKMKVRFSPDINQHLFQHGYQHLHLLKSVACCQLPLWETTFKKFCSAVFNVMLYKDLCYT